MTGVKGTRVESKVRAAIPLVRVLTQARFETLGLLRHGEQLLVSLVLPVAALLILAQTAYPGLTSGEWAGVDTIEVLVPGILGLAVVSTAFTGQAILLGFERRWGVLRLLGTTPLGRGGLLGAKVISVLAILTLQVVVIGVAGVALGWRPQLAAVVTGIALLVLGTAVFALLAACLGGSLRAEAVLALANLLWVVIAGAGLVLPVSTLPDSVELVARWLPSGALGEGLRMAFTGAGFDIMALTTLLVWGVVAAVVARRVFRWSD